LFFDSVLEKGGQGKMEERRRAGIVTGAGGAIGGAIAIKLAEIGFTVLVNGRTREKAHATCEKIKELGGHAIPNYADVLIEEEVDTMVEQALQEFRGIDFLVNVVGGTRNTWIGDMTVEEWDYVIDINLKTTFLCTRAVIKHMMSQKFGRIINISSFAKDGVTWFAPLRFSRIHYSAANAGLVGFTRALAIELGEYGITANCVVPGPIPIPRSEKLWERVEADPKVAVKPLSLIPLKRYGTPGDVANMVAFLVSDEASYITGGEFYVTGGL
jgi:3-oxoacyl-[acyl-carrier protein] reductase